MSGATVGVTHSRLRKKGGQLARICGASTKTGLCRNAPAPHRNPELAAIGCGVRNGRCARHGGYSTGPKSLAIRATLAEAMQRRHAVAARAEGMRQPSWQLRVRMQAWKDRRTWWQAMDDAGLSRRALQRLLRGAYCTPDELAAARAALDGERAEDDDEEEDDDDGER